MIRADINAALDYYLDLARNALATPNPVEGEPPVPFSGKSFVQPGGEVAWDQCGPDSCGQLWSRFVQAVPVYDTPKANGVACVVRWDVTLAVGVLRCVTGPNARGVFPSAETITGEGHEFGSDLLDLMTAIECDPTKYRVTSAAPLGPQGGCAGSEVTFVVRMTPCCG